MGQQTQNKGQVNTISSTAKEEGCCSGEKGHVHGNDNTAQVQTINKDQLLGKIKSNSGVQIVNVLSPEHYGEGFIKGSKKIPLNQLDGRLGELDKTKEIVTYCASYDCSASLKAAEKLAAKGFKVKAYEGGIKEWSEAGLPIDK
jgi:rhodanese-related sulfurtransferase